MQMRCGGEADASSCVGKHVAGRMADTHVSKRFLKEIRGLGADQALQYKSNGNMQNFS